MKVSFDFDDTLSKEHVQAYAKELIARKIDVHIVTSRYEDPEKYINLPQNERNHNDLFSVVEKLKLTRDKIHFTNFCDKSEFFNEHQDFVWHLDDNYYEITSMLNSKKCKTIPIDINSSSYKQKCDRIINRRIV